MFIYIYFFVVEYFNLDIFYELSNLTSDGGSNRDILYQEVFESIINMPYISLFLGLGYNAVALSSSAFSSAHNDFLEIIYDYGFIGLILYILFIIKIVKYNIILYKDSSIYAEGFSVSIILFLVISMFSHLILYQTYFFYLLIYWGIHIGKIDLAKRNALPIYIK
jgi:O-antigen ligase